MTNLIEFLAANNITVVSDPATTINDGLNLRKYQDWNLKPKKPILSKNPTAEDAQVFAAQMAQYEEDLVGWETIEAENAKWNEEIENMVADFIREESGLNHLRVSDKVKINMWKKAWDDGHSSGYVQIYYELCELVEMLTD